jgi:hypothetical protein
MTWHPPYDKILLAAFTVLVDHSLGLCYVYL